MLSDTDIRKEIEVKRNGSTNGISIEPFEDKYLTPVGYDLRVGIKGFSWNNKHEIDIKQEKRIEIQPKDTVVIETLESMSISKEIAGTIHSMVSQTIPQGLSHISTTVVPGWRGKLLISIHNYRDCSVELRFKDSFCTVCFYRVESESKASLGNPVDRVDLWRQLKDKAKEEKERLLQKKQEEEGRQAKELQTTKKKKKQNATIRNILLVFFILLVCFSAVQISNTNPTQGSVIATLFAGLSPIIVILWQHLSPD